MVRVNILKPTGIDVVTPAETGQVDVDINRDTAVKVNPTVDVKITNNRLKTYVFELNARESLDGNLMIYDI